MQAKICDRCGAIWKDEPGCDIYVQSICMSKDSSYSDKIGDWDLCTKCREGLFEYLNPIESLQ